MWIADSDTAVSRNNSLPTLENKLSHHNPKRFIAYCASDRATTSIQFFFPAECWHKSEKSHPLSSIFSFFNISKRKMTSC